MHKYRNKLSVHMTPLLCITGALMLLVLPLSWILGAVIAACFHELCHFGMICLCGGTVHSIEIGTGGAKMETSALTKGKELLCALAGPMGGLCLLFLIRWIPRIAICAAIHSLYNLLPVFPLDGGRALRCCLEMVLPVGYTERVCTWVETGIVLGLLAAALYGTLRFDLGIIPLLAAVILLFKTEKIKIPCKPRQQRLQ